MRHDLMTLRLVLAVAETGSISRGADRVSLALAAASSRITGFEARLGFKLFVRHARGVHATQNCKALCRRIEELNSALSAFDNEALSFSRGVTGHLRIAATPEAVAARLIGRLSAFVTRHADVTFSIIERPGAEVERLVLVGEADLAIYPRPHLGPRLASRVFGGGRWHALVPRGHAKAGLPALAFADLMELPILGVDRSSEFGAAFAREAARRGKALSHTLCDPVSIARLVEAGLGVGVISDASAAQARAMYDVDVLPIDDPMAPFELVIGRPRREHVPTLTQKAFDELARLEAADLRSVCAA